MKQHIFIVEIPTPNYEGNDIFFQRLHFDKSPTKEIVLNVLKIFHEQDKDNPIYNGDWKHCIESVEQVIDQDWVMVTPIGLCRSNTFVNVKLDKLIRKAALTWMVEEVIEG